MASQYRPFDPKRSRAVLIGCHEYPADSEFDNLPSVEHSLGAMNNLLENWGLSRSNCAQFTSLDRDLVADDVIRAIERTAKRSPEQLDLFLVYFSGHGYTLPDRGLYLALSKTMQLDSSIGSLPFQDIADTVQKASFPADHVIVILDCCKAGAALEHLRVEMQKPGAAEKIALLVAAGKDVPARSPVEHGPSFFTGALVRAVTELASPTTQYLSLDHLAWVIEKQAEDYNSKLDPILDSDKWVPAPLVSPGQIRHMPWLPNQAAQEVPSASGQDSPQLPSQVAGDLEPPADPEAASAAGPPRQESPAPMGLKWPWAYQRTGRPVLSRPKEFAQLQDRSRSGAVVPVTGEPGVGKKFLTETFLGAPEGVCTALPKNPYVLRLDLDLIRYNSPAPALRSLQFALGLTREHTANLGQTVADFAEARESAVWELARRADGRPLVLYITLRATRADLRKVYGDLEQLLAYPLFRDALVLLVTARGAGGVTGGGQLMPAAAVNVPGLERDEAAKMLHQLLDEWGITGPDPAEALRIAGDEFIALRPAVLMQAIAALGARTTVVNEKPDSARLAKEIRRATHYVIEPTLIESGCRLQEGAAPGALAILLAWVQLGAPALDMDELPAALQPLKGVAMWLQASGVLVGSVPDGSVPEVTISSVAQDALREIRRRLQLSHDDRYGENWVPDALLGLPHADEADIDRLISDATAQLLNHLHEYDEPLISEEVDAHHTEDSERSTGALQVMGALERALNELDELELPAGSRTDEWSETRYVIVTNLLAQSTDVPFLPVDLEESKEGLGKLRSRLQIRAQGAFPRFQLGIAQLNILSRLPVDTPALRENLSEVLTHLEDEISRSRCINHTEINTLDRLTFLCARRLEAVDDVVDFRTLVLESLADEFSLDFSPGRVKKSSPWLAGVLKLWNSPMTATSSEGSHGR